MTDDKQDPSVVAWQYRYWYSSGEAGVWLNERRDDADDLLESGVLIREETRALSLTSDLTAMADFEKDCWVAMRSLLELCHFDWRDVDPGDGVTADDAREYIATTINEIELAEKRNLARAEAAEQERDELREALSLNPRWCLEMGYDRGDEEGDYGWIVFEVSGNVNDREWEQVGFGDTPLAALKSARAALSKPKPHDETRGRG